MLFNVEKIAMSDSDLDISNIEGNAIDTAGVMLASAEAVTRTGSGFR